MTATNYSTANYWGSKGASRVILARELNMDEVTDMKPRASAGSTGSGSWHDQHLSFQAAPGEQLYAAAGQTGE